MILRTKDQMKNWPNGFTDPDYYRTYGKGHRLFNFLTKYLPFEDLDMLRAYAPCFDNEMPEHPAVFLSEKDQNKGTKGRRNIKIGKLLKVLKPTASDSDIEEIVMDYRRVFCSQYSLKLIKTSDGDEIADIYKKISLKYTPHCGEKYLHDSCMRHKFPNLKHHPAEAYGSGDWTLYAAITDEDFLAARCIVFRDLYRMPIYSTTDRSLKFIEQFVKDFDFLDSVHNLEPHKPKLLKLQSSSGDIIVPYLDNISDEEFVFVKDTKNRFLEISIHKCSNCVGILGSASGILDDLSSICSVEDCADEVYDHDDMDNGLCSYHYEAYLESVWEDEDE